MHNKFLIIIIFFLFNYLSSQDLNSINTSSNENNLNYIVGIINIDLIHEPNIEKNVNENRNDIISYFPNPTEDFVNIIIKDKNLKELEFKIYNSNGMLLDVQRIQNKINMIKFPKGIYLISCLNENTEPFKVIKK
jgi:hypothetical protein